MGSRRTLGFKQACLLLIALSAIHFGCSRPKEGVVFTDDFDGGRWTLPSVTAVFSGVSTVEDVQGFKAVGFRGKFLRNKSQGDPAAATTLTLTGLPEHKFMTLKFLLALIDTWDGNCGPTRVAAGGAPNSTHCPDYFNVTVDGEPIFRETFFFESALPQTYDEKRRGTLLSRDVDFNKGGNDLLYDMSHDSAFQHIHHSRDTVMISFFASGSGWQGGDDESWGIDDLTVELDSVPRRGLPRKPSAHE
jgi:hypothetical protein